MVFSRDEFTRDAVLFCDAFQALDGDNNRLILTKWEVKGEPGNVHVSHPPILREIPKSGVTEEETDHKSTFEWYEDHDILVDPDTVLQPPDPSQQAHHVKWKFSIVFSDTWRVPVLYFTVQHEDGTLLLRSQVLEVIMNVDDNEIANTWDFVSYEEHPTTGEPSFFLHPCQTLARVQQLLQTQQTAGVSPLLSWVAMILPAVGFRIPTRAFIRLQTWIAKQQL
jgi:hypothetical protein